MKMTVVRYRTKPETADENQRLIEAVFQELRATSRKGCPVSLLATER